MKFMSTRLIARDVKMVVSFYELVLQVKATWLAPVFAEIATPVATVAVGSVETVALFKAGSAEPGANRTAILEFLVDNVEQEYERLKDKVEQEYERLKDKVDIVHEPRMLPWGNMAAQFRDPEGTIVSLFTPVTEEARKRFQIR